MSLFSKLSHINMLEGSLWDKLILFSLPLALTNVLQQLFNTADVAVLGHYVGRDAMASVGSLTPLIGLFVNLFLGISLGANVVIARHFGSKAKDAIVAASNSAFLLALVLGLGCFVCCFPFSRGILTLLAVPEEIIPASQEYLQYYLLGLPFLSLYNFIAAMLRSQGDTTSPFISLGIASILNIGLNLCAVCLFDLGVAGVAMATSLSNCLSALLLLFVAARRSVFGLFRQSQRPKRPEMAEIIRIGFPAAIQGMVFCFSNIIVQSAINSLGANVIAGSAAAFTVEINLYCLMSAFAQAGTTFVSQNFGARNLRRCLTVTRVTLALTLPLNIVMSVLILLAAPSLLGFFTQDPAVAETAMLRIWYIVAPNVVTIFIDVLSGALRGYGCSMPPAIATLVSICCVRIVWVFTIFRWFPTFDTLLLSYPLSWLVTAIFITIVYLRFKRVVLFHKHSITIKR